MTEVYTDGSHRGSNLGVWGTQSRFFRRAHRSEVRRRLSEVLIAQGHLPRSPAPEPGDLIPE